MLKKTLKYLVLTYLIGSSCLAISLNYIGEFDPVAIAVKLKGEGQRDQALDVIEFGLKNEIGDQKRLKNLQDQYKYSAFEKTKDLFWHGAIKGNVFNIYSGVGCIAADLSLVGDIRDISKEGYKLFMDKEVDYVVLCLSAVGVGTNVIELTGVGTPAGAAADAGASVLKNLAKYMTTVLKRIPEGVLKVFMSGKKVGTKMYGKIWHLFKETQFSIPSLTTILSEVKDVKYLETTIDITRNLKKGAVIFISKTGEKGFKTYEYFRKLKIGNFFISSFKRNPKGVLGITKCHTLIGSFKFFQKHGFLVSIALALGIGACILAMFGLWLPITTLLLSLGYFIWALRPGKRKKNRLIASNQSSGAIETKTVIEPNVDGGQVTAL